MRRIALALFLAAASAFAGDLPIVRGLAAPPEPDGSMRLSVDPEAYRLLWERGAGVVRAFPLPDGREVDLELRAFSVLAPGARLVDVGRSGEREVPPPAVRFFRGTVTGHEESLVVLGLFQGRVAGTIRLDDRSFGFGPRSLSLGSPDASALSVWDAASEKGEAICEGAGDEALDAELAAVRPFSPILPTAPLGGDPQLRIDLALDTTTEWCAHFGNDVSAAQLYLLGLVAQISAIYDSEISVLVQVPFLRTFCGTTDPYTDGLTSLSNRQQLLDELDAEWSANMDSVDRTVAHLFTVSSTSSAGGLARTVTCSGPTCTHVLCNMDSGYAVTMLPASGGSAATFEIQVAGHELGHNHSCPHSNCLQDGGGQWLSTCAVETCGVNPWCQATGCYPGPTNTAMTGALMSSGCNARISQLGVTVDSILRGAAEAASCVEAAGLPGAVTQPTGGLLLSRLALCPTTTITTDDGGVNTSWGACSGCQYAWIKRFTPGCHPFRVTDLQVRVSNVSVGRPIRLLVYVDPEGTGDPSNALLVSSEDVTVQAVGAFHSYALAAPVTVGAGDVYLGVYDLQESTPAPFIAAMDTNTLAGDSYSAINTTSPQSFAPRPEGTWLIRAGGGAVAAGSVGLEWGAACNDLTTPGQDYAVYRGDLGVFDEYDSLTCSTGTSRSYVAEGGPPSGFFLVVPHTSVAEGSYGRTSAGAERPPADAACENQSFEACP